MPAYRADRFIREALESVRRQRYANWEVIVVEDASHGDTRSIVDRFACEVPQRRVVYDRHEENRGVSATRNRAMGLGRGEFFAFLDPDDRWFDTHLERAVAALESEQADVAYSTSVMIEDGSGFLGGLWGPTRDELKRFPDGLPRRCHLVPSAVVLRRSVTDRVGLFDTDPGLQFCEDLDYWLRSAAAGMKFVHVGGCHCMYRKGAAGAATNNVRRAVERHAYVLARHADNAALSRRAYRRALSYYRLAAGVLNLEVDKRRAAGFFYRAWRARPERIDLLVLTALAVTVLPLVPTGWFVRRLKRARGYA
jgi:glycosyltransferase involved in cell wall biosynthesis